MGYNFRFDGKLQLNKKPSSKALENLKSIENQCQWQLTKDQLGIEHNGEDKFWDYEYWLQWIIDFILEPDEIVVKGKIQYRGSSFDDIGYLYVESNRVVKYLAIVVPFSVFEPFKEFLSKDFQPPLVVSNTKYYETFNGPILPFENTTDYQDNSSLQLQELTDFKDFVLQSEHGSKLFTEWVKTRNMF
jgi:hypothetical protein